jgi:hypothetical protein
MRERDFACSMSASLAKRVHPCLKSLLTYMSIRDEINKRIAERRLLTLEPTIPGDPVERTMLVSSELRGLLDGPWDSEATERRAGRLRADLERFITGQQVAMCLSPSAGATAYMRRLDRPSDEVWEIRSVDPRPAIRVFGRFAEIDVFVALNWAKRRVLGEGTSLQWHLAIIERQQMWGKLFPECEPIHGDSIRDYVSANAFLV